MQTSSQFIAQPHQLCVPAFIWNLRQSASKIDRTENELGQLDSTILCCLSVFVPSAPLVSR
jgi:hypothetical protein